MLKKYNIKSYAFVFVLALVLILPVNAIAQSNAVPQGNVVPQRSAVPQVNTVPQRNTVPQASSVPQTSAVPPKQKLSVSAVLAKKIATLEGELSRTKTALLTTGNAGIAKDKTINMFTASMQSLQGAVSEKDTQLATLYEEIKGLQGVASQRDTALVTLQDIHKQNKEVITCYRKALSAWDNQLRGQGLTEQDRLTISTILHSAISKCPPI